jgi:hypothetical protein
MKKPTLKSTIIGIVLSGAFYGLLSNAHVGIFHCTITQETISSQSDSTAPVKTEEVSGTCSLLDVSRDARKRDGKVVDESTLDPIGWVLCGVWLGCVPFGIGLLIGGRKEDAAPSVEA